MSNLFGKLFLGKFGYAKGLTPWRIFYLGMVYVALPIGLFHWYVTLSVLQIADIMLSDYAEDAEVKLKPFYTWNGDFGVRDLRIQPSDASIPALTVGEIRLVTPGWLWTLDLFNPPSGEKRHNLFSRKGRNSAAVDALGKLFGGGEKEPEGLIPPARRLAVVMTDAHVTFAGFLPEDLEEPSLGSVGMVSGLPLEAEGCSGDHYWSAEDVTLMGMSYPGSKVTWQYEVTTPGSLTITSSIDSPGIGYGESSETLKLEKPDHYLTSDEDGTLTELRWHYVDRGFNEKRNKYCASRDHVPSAEFLQRHLAAFRRLAAAGGYAPTPEVEARLMHFAEKGGELTVVAHPDTSIAFEHYAQYTPDARARLFNATIEASGMGPPIPLVVTSVPAQPIPEDFNGTTWELIARERGIAVKPAADSDRARPQLAGMAPKPAAEAAPVQAMDSKVTPEDDFADDPASKKHANEIAFADLKNFIGHTVRVELDSGHRIGVLESATAGTVVVRVRAVSGQASLTFTKQSVVRVTRLN